MPFWYHRGMDEHEHSTAAVQRCLDQLADAEVPEPVVRALLERAVGRLRVLCGTLLHRSYPRLARPPLNLQTDEMLSAVVERLLKALRKVHPRTVRDFFALANRHMRWELNDLARRLDEAQRVVELREDLAATRDASSTSAATATRARLGARGLRILAAIDDLSDEERQVFEFVRIQGLTQPETAELLGVSTKTVQRRLHRGLLLLSESLADLRPANASAMG